MILVDTSVLSLALRRRDRTRLTVAEKSTVEAFEVLSEQEEVLLIGVIRQELLSGIRHASQFHQLRHLLDGYDYAETTLADHDVAAQCYNTCRAAGIAAGGVDMLICGTAVRQDLPVFTIDPDFDHYAAHIKFRRYQP